MFIGLGSSGLGAFPGGCTPSTSKADWLKQLEQLRQWTPECLIQTDFIKIQTSVYSEETLGNVREQWQRCTAQDCFSHLRLLASERVTAAATASLGAGTLLSLGYFDALFIIVCGLYPCAMTKETASLVSVNTVHAETRQPHILINKQGLVQQKGRLLLLLPAHRENRKDALVALNWCKGCIKYQILLHKWSECKIWLVGKLQKESAFECVHITAAGFKGRYPALTTLMPSASHWYILHIFSADNGIRTQCTQTCKFYHDWMCPQAFLSLH